MHSTQPNPLDGRASLPPRRPPDTASLRGRSALGGATGGGVVGCSVSVESRASWESRSTRGSPPVPASSATSAARRRSSEGRNQEALRLHPVVPALIRKTLCPVELSTGRRLAPETRIAADLN